MPKAMITNGFELTIVAVLIGLLMVISYLFGSLASIRKYQKQLDELQAMGNNTFIKVYEIEKEYFREMGEKFPKLAELANKNIDRVNDEISKLKDQQ